MSDKDLDHIYPGVGRLAYFLSYVGIIVATMVVVIKFGPESSVFRMFSLAAMIGGFALDVMRLRNIGVSQWFAMLRLVPYVGSLFAIALLSAQTGWVETRRLDRTGVIIVAVNVALIAFVLYMIFWSSAAAVFRMVG